MHVTPALKASNSVSKIISSRPKTCESSRRIMAPNLNANRFLLYSMSSQTNSIYFEDSNKYRRPATAQGSNKNLKSSAKLEPRLKEIVIDPPRPSSAIRQRLVGGSQFTSMPRGGRCRKCSSLMNDLKKSAEEALHFKSLFHSLNFNDGRVSRDTEMKQQIKQLRISEMELLRELEISRTLYSDLENENMYLISRLKKCQLPNELERPRCHGEMIMKNEHLFICKKKNDLCKNDAYIMKNHDSIDKSLLKAENKICLLESELLERDHALQNIKIQLSKLKSEMECLKKLHHKNFDNLREEHEKKILRVRVQSKVAEENFLKQIADLDENNKKQNSYIEISPVINVHLETTRCIKVIGSSSSQIIHDFVKGNILPIFTRLILRSSSLDDNNSSELQSKQWISALLLELEHEVEENIAQIFQKSYML